MRLTHGRNADIDGVQRRLCSLWSHLPQVSTSCMDLRVSTRDQALQFVDSFQELSRCFKSQMPRLYWEVKADI